MVLTTHTTKNKTNAMSTNWQHALHLHSHVSPEAHREITSRLQKIKEEQDIQTVYTLESGSRAWNFESPDSDYDVRFVYLKPLVHYLRIDTNYTRDVIDIEYPTDGTYDLNGWDITKFFKLLIDSNPTAIEWLQSTLVYECNKEFYEAAWAIARQSFNPAASMWHYRHMASMNFNKYLLKKNPLLQKKYLYVIRPILCLRWVIKFKSPPPLDIEKLLFLFRDDEREIHKEVLKLLAIKRLSSEKEFTPPNLVLQDLCSRELDIDYKKVSRENELGRELDKGPLYQQANAIFIKLLQERESFRTLESHQSLPTK